MDRLYAIKRPLKYSEVLKKDQLMRYFWNKTSNSKMLKKFKNFFNPFKPWYQAF